MLLLYAGFNVPSQIPLYCRVCGLIIVRRHLQNAPAKMIITAHLLAAELLRIHLYADQCRVRVALFHIDDFGV